MGIRLWLYVGITAGLIALVAYAGYRLDSRGYDRCRAEMVAAAVAAEQEDHKRYLAAVQRGNDLSAKLAASQAQNAQLRSNHATAAATIIGTCPDTLRLLHDAAARGEDLPGATGPSLAAPRTVEASAIGAAIAGNYATARECIDQLNALIDWHEQVK